MAQWHTVDLTNFDVAPAAYWRERERIVFSVIADRLMRGEDALPGGDAWS